MSKKTIAQKNLPTHLPIHAGLTIILALKVFDVPAWVYGAAGAVWVIWLIAAIMVIATRDYVDVFNVFKVAEKKNVTGPHIIRNVKDK